MLNDLTEILTTLYDIKQKLESGNPVFIPEVFTKINYIGLLSERIENRELKIIITEFETKLKLQQNDNTSQLKKSYVRDAYGRVFRKVIKLIQLSDIAQLNI